MNLNEKELLDQVKRFPASWTEEVLVRHIENLERIIRQNKAELEVLSR